MKARRNPVGLPLRLPPDLPLVRVGNGFHTHLMDKKTGLHLCLSGKNAGIAGGSGAKPDVFRSDASAVTCYRCIKLAQLNMEQGREPWDRGQRRMANTNPQVPVWPRSFTPSYDKTNSPDQEEVLSQSTYNQVVAECDDDPSGPVCKRRTDKVPDQRKHFMLQGGRSEVRYGGTYPAAPKKGGPRSEGMGRPPRGETFPTIPGVEGKSISPRAQRRLAQGLYDWQARTQPTALRPNMPGKLPKLLPAATAKEVLTEQIRQAIQNYMSQTDPSGFTVPRTPTSLIQAGMPEKAARILVERRAGSRFVPRREPVQYREPLAITIQKATGKQLQADIRDDIPRLLLGGQPVTEIRDDEDTRLFDSDDIDELLKEYVDQGEEQGSNLATLFLAALEEEIQTSGLTGLRFLTDRTIWTVPLTQHSKLETGPFPEQGVRYRYLRNVSLDKLPGLLASISTRKKRTGRRLPPLG